MNSWLKIQSNFFKSSIKFILKIKISKYIFNFQVPIFVDKDREYYKEMVHKTNGLIFPGGGRNITSSSFRTAAEILFDLAIEANDRGEHYMIWGECMGLQILTVLMVKKYLHNPNHSDNWLVNCNAEDMALNLDFKIDPNKTRMFANADQKVIDVLKKDFVTPNFHYNCMTPENFEKSNLTKFFRIISTSVDSGGLEFISTYESLNESRPIYALQWHPEKISFEFINNSRQQHIPHTSDANLVAQYMAKFLVDQTRKNKNHFSSVAEENEYIIYQYFPRFTYKQDNEDKGELFSQLYEWAINPEFFTKSRKILALAICLSISLILLPIVGFVCYKIGLRKRLQDNESQPILEQ